MRTMGVFRAVTILVQSAGRAKLARKLVQAHPRRRACMRIQSVVRGRRVRRHLSSILAELRRVRAADTLARFLQTARLNQLKMRLAGLVHGGMDVVYATRADQIVDFLRACKQQASKDRNVSAVHRHVLRLRADAEERARARSNASEFDWRSAMQDVKDWQDADARIEEVAEGVLFAKAASRRNLLQALRFEGVSSSSLDEATPRRMPSDAPSGNHSFTSHRSSRSGSA